MRVEYPKDYMENLKWRAELQVQCEKDAEYRHGVKKLFNEDVLFAFNAFFFTYDVRKRPRQHQPFCTYPYQDEFILKVADAIDKGYDLPIEKSRDMGASYVVIYTFLWYWLSPIGGGDFLMGSRIEDYVDKRGDMRSLFEKLRYGLYKLPKFLIPEGFIESKHDNYMRLVNPKTQSSITGESSNPNFSTGGRYKAILYDEFAKWEHDEPAWTAGGDATPCRIPNSTPFGAAGTHYELVTSGQDKLRLTPQVRVAF